MPKKTAHRSTSGITPPSLHAEDRAAGRRRVGLGILYKRKSLPPDQRSMAAFCSRIGISESVLSRVESGKISCPLEIVNSIAAVTGCDPREIIDPDFHPPAPVHPFHKAMGFLEQCESMGVEAIFADRTAALTHVLPFATEMRRGRVLLSGSSLRGLDQQAEHPFVRRLMDFCHDPKFDVKVIMTHPKLGHNREYHERRPRGSIVGEILTGINWCLDVWGLKPCSIRLSLASPSSFCLFLVDGPHGRAIVNPYPTMRQAYLSYALAVRSFDGVNSNDVAVSVYRTYLSANFEEPWQDDGVTVELARGLEEWKDAIQNEEKTGTDDGGQGQLDPHLLRQIDLALATCGRSEKAAR